jgi:hypothetical protein
MATRDDQREPTTGLDDLDNGLDERGRIRREGELVRVDPAFAPLVADTEAALKDLLGRRLHSIYLYGSVPRGAAVIGRSDLDVEVVLHDDPTDDERSAIGRLATDLDQTHDVVDGVGIIVDSRSNILTPAQQYDNAFQISCLCTPLWGPDLADELPEQYPNRRLARYMTSGTPAAFNRLQTALLEPATPRLDLVRQRAGRRVARLAFTCVLFRWPGWTSDPISMHRVITSFYPEHSEELAISIQLGWGRLHGHPPLSPHDHDEASSLLSTSAPWWTNEHRRVTTSAE